MSNICQISISLNNISLLTKRLITCTSSLHHIFADYSRSFNEVWHIKFKPTPGPAIKTRCGPLWWLTDIHVAHGIDVIFCFTQCTYQAISGTKTKVYGSKFKTHKRWEFWEKKNAHLKGLVFRHSCFIGFEWGPSILKQICQALCALLDFISTRNVINMRYVCLASDEFPLRMVTNDNKLTIYIFQYSQNHFLLEVVLRIEFCTKVQTYCEWA